MDDVVRIVDPYRRSVLIAAIILITSALVLYTLGVWGERRQGLLRPWHAAAFAAGIADVAWDAASISALIKQSIGAYGLKMPKLAMPLRVLLTGQAQTPSVDAVITLFPREVVQKRLSVAV